MHGYTDNPQRVAGPDELPSDRAASAESMADPEDSICSGIANIVLLAAEMQQLADLPPAPHVFEDAWKRNLTGPQIRHMEKAFVLSSRIARAE